MEREVQRRVRDRKKGSERKGTGVREKERDRRGERG